jgi:flagellar biosynthetic protein FliQ
MNSVQAIEISRAAMMLVLTIAGPMLIASLIVGVVVGLFQALTHVQEVTLTFVPKVLAIGLVMLLWLPTIGQALSVFTGRITDLIIAG